VKMLRLTPSQSNDLKRLKTVQNHPIDAR